MVIHNASFMVEHDREEDLLAWLRGRLKEIPVPGQMQVSAMREAGGADCSRAEAQTVSFQVRFESIDGAREWSRDVFAGLAAEFERRYAPQALVFTSIFEIIF